MSTVSNTGQCSRRRGLAWTPALHYQPPDVRRPCPALSTYSSQSAVTGETTGGGAPRHGRWPVPDPSVQSLWLRAPRCSHLARPHWAARRVAGRQRRAEAATLRAPERRSPPPHHVLSNERELEEKKPCPTRALHPAESVHHPSPQSQHEERNHPPNQRWPVGRREILGVCLCTGAACARPKSKGGT